MLNKLVERKKHKMDKIFAQINNYMLDRFNEDFPYKDLTDIDWTNIILFYKRKIKSTPLIKKVKRCISCDIKLMHFQKNILSVCFILINFNVERFDNILIEVKKHCQINYYDINFNGYNYVHLVNSLKSDCDNVIFTTILINENYFEDYYNNHIGRELLLLKLKYLYNSQVFFWNSALILKAINIACTKNNKKSFQYMHQVLYTFRRKNDLSIDYRHYKEFKEKVYRIVLELKQKCENDILTKKMTVPMALIYIKFVQNIHSCNSECINKIIRSFQRHKEYRIVSQLKLILPYVSLEQKQKITKILITIESRQLLQDLK